MLPVHGNFLEIRGQRSGRCTVTGVVSQRYGSIDDHVLYIDNYATSFKSISLPERTCAHNGMMVWYYASRTALHGKITICEDYWP